MKLYIYHYILNVTHICIYTQCIVYNRAFPHNFHIWCDFYLEQYGTLFFHFNVSWRRSLEAGWFCFYHSSVCASPILKPSPHSNSPLVFHMCFALHFSYWRFSISCFSNANRFGLSISLYPRVFLSETFWLNHHFPWDTGNQTWEWNGISPISGWLSHSKPYFLRAFLSYVSTHGRKGRVSQPRRSWSLVRPRAVRPPLGLPWAGDGGDFCERSGSRWEMNIWILHNLFRILDILKLLKFRV